MLGDPFSNRPFQGRPSMAFLEVLESLPMGQAVRNGVEERITSGLAPRSIAFAGFGGTDKEKSKLLAITASQINW
jgi:hypothetical protein